MASGPVGSLAISTIKPVAAGEELTIAYAFPKLPVAARRKALYNQYHFECRCQRCLEEIACGKSKSGVENGGWKACQDTKDRAGISRLSKLKMLKAKELKALLRKSGLSLQGTRKDLIARLLDEHL